MKKLFGWVLGGLLLLASPTFAQDSKLSELDAIVPTGDDLVYVVDDPSGTPASKKSTITNVLAIHVDDTSAAHLAGSIGYTPTQELDWDVTPDEVASALNELAVRIRDIEDGDTAIGLADEATALAANGTNCGVGEAARGVDASGNAEGCFTAGAGVSDAADVTFTPAGNLAATDVQAALEELDNEKLGTGATAVAATALASNPANCSAGSFPLGIAASGAVENCTALPTTISGTTDQIAASAATGAIVLSIPTNPIFQGNATATSFVGDLTGNADSATEATALSANGANCDPGEAARGVDASGVAEDCFTPAGGVSGGAAGVLARYATADTVEQSGISEDGSNTLITLPPIIGDCSTNCLTLDSEVTGAKTVVFKNLAGDVAIKTGTLTENKCLIANSSGQIVAGAPACHQIAVELEIFAPTETVTTGDGKRYFRIPTKMNGMNLIAVSANVITAGTTNTTNIDLTRCVAATTGNACSSTTADMLSTNLTIDSGENSSSDAAAAAVINSSADDVSTGQLIRVDIDAVQTTPPAGLILLLEFGA